MYHAWQEGDSEFFRLNCTARLCELKAYEETRNRELWDWMWELIQFEQVGIDIRDFVGHWPLAVVRAWAEFKPRLVAGMREDDIAKEVRQREQHGNDQGSHRAPGEEPDWP